MHKGSDRGITEKRRNAEGKRERHKGDRCIREERAIDRQKERGGEIGEGMGGIRGERGEGGRQRERGREKERAREGGRDIQGRRDIKREMKKGK